MLWRQTACVETMMLSFTRWMILGKFFKPLGLSFIICEMGILMGSNLQMQNDSSNVEHLESAQKILVIVIAVILFKLSANTQQKINEEIKPTKENSGENAY